MHPLLHRRLSAARVPRPRARSAAASAAAGRACRRRRGRASAARSAASSAITRRSAAHRLGLRQLDHLVAVEHEVPAPLAHAHEPAHPLGRPAAPRRAAPAPRARAPSAPSPAISGRSGRRSRLSISATRTPFWSRSSSPSSERQTTTGTRSIARISRTPLGSARTRARSTASSASIRSRTAPTSSSRLETGSRTKAATRICLGEVAADVRHRRSR